MQLTQPFESILNGLARKAWTQKTCDRECWQPLPPDLGSLTPVGGWGSKAPGIIGILYESLSIVSWNARALFHSNGSMRNAKIQYVHTLLKSFDIVIIEDTHGCEFDVHRFRHTCKHHHIYWSGGPDCNTGGMLVAISFRIKNLTVREPTFSQVIEGRLVRLCMYFPLISRLL